MTLQWVGEEGEALWPWQSLARPGPLANPLEWDAWVLSWSGKGVRPSGQSRGDEPGCLVSFPPGLGGVWVPVVRAGSPDA